MQPSILLTGATGALGLALLPSLLRDYDNHDVFCIVRAKSDKDASLRLAELLKDCELDPCDVARVHALRGDVSLPFFDLSDSAYKMLASRTEKIFHLAASVDFNASLLESRSANVHSAIHILALSRICKKRYEPEFKINYVSTAYVVGDRRKQLKESELAMGQSFWNSYEQSKFEAEALIERSKSEMPITVFRPSQIIGSSLTGKITKFFGFYEFVGLATRGRSNILVADPQARPDMVPSDYICNAMLHLTKCDASIGKTYHLAAGLAHSITVSEVVDSVLEVMREHNEKLEELARPKILLTDRLRFDATTDELDRYNYSAQKLLMRTYQPYLAYERDFDVESTHGILEAAGIAIPSMKDAIKITTDYALRSRTRRRESFIKQTLTN